MATSHTARPGAARSKSIRAAAWPSRKTTLSGHTSLWHSIVPPAGSARDRGHSAHASTAMAALASCRRRSSPPTDLNAVSVIAQRGNGGRATSPGMKVRYSRPSAVRRIGLGAASNPCSSSARRWAWRARAVRGAGRSTRAPWRKTAPAFIMPPTRASPSAVSPSAVMSITLPSGRPGVGRSRNALRSRSPWCPPQSLRENSLAEPRQPLLGSRRPCKRARRWYP